VFVVTWSWPKSHSKVASELSQRLCLDDDTINIAAVALHAVTLCVCM